MSKVLLTSVRALTTALLTAAAGPNPGDRNSVKIGGVSNVQDHTVITTVSSLESGFPAKVDIGNYVTIGP